MQITIVYSAAEIRGSWSVLQDYLLIAMREKEA